MKSDEGRELELVQNSGGNTKSKTKSKQRSQQKEKRSQQIKQVRDSNLGEKDQRTLWWPAYE